MQIGNTRTAPTTTTTTTARPAEQQQPTAPAPPPRPLEAIGRFASTFVQGAAREFTQLTGLGAHPQAASTTSVDGAQRTQQKQGFFDPAAVPQLSQNNPVGKDASYLNGPSNCGPTSMAMLARGMGYGEGLSDAQLISKFVGIGGSGGAGTNMVGIKNIAAELGLTCDVKDKPDLASIKAALEQGKAVMVCGDWYSQPQHFDPSKGPSGHYLLLTGLDKDGNFLLRDPYVENSTCEVKYPPPPSLTPDQLKTFLAKNSGGSSFTLAPPAAQNTMAQVRLAG